MAIKTRKKKTFKRKVKTGVNAISMDQPYEKYRQEFRAEVDSKEYAQIVKGFIKRNFPKQTAKSLLKVPDHKVSYSHIAAYCVLKENNKEIPESSQIWMDNMFTDLEAEGSVIVKEKKKEEKTKAYQPSIQERMAEQLSEIIGQFELWVDAQPNKDVPKMFDWLKKNAVAQAHIKKIRAYYEPIEAEFLELTKKTCDEEFKESFNLTPAQVKRHIKFFEAMMNDLDAYENLKKATRKTRKPKPKSADKLVAKLKYKKDDNKYKIVSADPTSIVGALEVWTFNTKNRKLGKYVSQDLVALSVKGASIINFNENKSFQKTIRKPEEKLAEFNKAGKVALRKFLEDIRATSTKLNGRMNEHIVILKVVK